jgi:protoheme IX farnesyltransferase
MTTMTSPPSAPAAEAVALDCPSLASGLSRLAAYLELAKPRIGLMVLLCVAVGYVAGSAGTFRIVPLVHACTGILLAVIASSALNQFFERETDARMPRTQGRPLPSDRLAPSEVFWFALACGLASCVYLWTALNPLTAGLTGLTIVLYALCYTPLKRHTALCTAVGAVPGAMPPVLGWVAAGAPLNGAAFSLFAILFVWQFPHFLAIAWLYKDQYRRAGLKMLPAEGRSGVTGAVAAGYALVLIPVSLLPVQGGLAGVGYAAAALALGILYAWTALAFQRQETRGNARLVLWASLLYLPGVLLALTFDHLRLLS